VVVSRGWRRISLQGNKTDVAITVHQNYLFKVEVVENIYKTPKDLETFTPRYWKKIFSA